MPRKDRIFVGTEVLVAKTLAQAQREFDKGTAHVCEEDGNPYHVMMDWKESTEHFFCPDCHEPTHETRGHWCPRKQKNVVVPRPEGMAAKGLKADARLLEDALSALAFETDADSMARRNADAALKRVMSLAKAGLAVFGQQARSILKEMSP